MLTLDSEYDISTYQSLFQAWPLSWDCELSDHTYLHLIRIWHPWKAFEAKIPAKGPKLLLFSYLGWTISLLILLIEDCSWKSNELEKQKSQRNQFFLKPVEQSCMIFSLQKEKVRYMGQVFLKGASLKNVNFCRSQYVLSPGLIKH